MFTAGKIAKIHIPHKSRKATNAASQFNCKCSAVALCGKVLLYCSHLLQVEHFKLVDFWYLCSVTWRHRVAILCTRVASRPTLRASRTWLHMLSHDTALCYCTVHTICKLTVAGRQSSGLVAYIACSVYSARFKFTTVVRRWLCWSRCALLSLSFD